MSAELYDWVLVVTGPYGKTREYQLSHKYASSEAAVKEAEDIADEVYREDDIGWSVNRVCEVDE